MSTRCILYCYFALFRVWGGIVFEQKQMDLSCICSQFVLSLFSEKEDLIMKEKGRRPRMRTNCKEALDLLAKIRADGGKQRLNKLGEWLATNPEPLFTWDEKDLKYIMK